VEDRAREISAVRYGIAQAGIREIGETKTGRGQIGIGD